MFLADFTRGHDFSTGPTSQVGDGRVPFVPERSESRLIAPAVRGSNDAMDSSASSTLAFRACVQPMPTRCRWLPESLADRN